MILVLVFYPLAFHTGMIKWDILEINLPYRYFISECLNHGELPLWNPYIRGGFPQSAEPMTWYLPTWLLSFVFGYNLQVMHWEFLAHYWMAGMGMYFLLRHLTNSVPIRLSLAGAYMLSGLMISNAQHFGWIVSAAWIPWIFYFFWSAVRYRKVKYALLFALTYHLLLSGGYPAFFIITSYLLLGMAIYWMYKNYLKDSLYQLLKLMGIAAVFFIGLSLVVVISSFELAGHISRSNLFGTDYIFEYPMPWNAFISLLYPLAVTTDMAFWGEDLAIINTYFGFLPLLLVIYGWIKKNTAVIKLSLLGLFFFGVSMGEVLPLRGWLAHLPYMDLFKFPTLFRLFGYLSLLVAAAYSLIQYKKSDADSAWLSRLILGYSVFSLLVFSWVWSTAGWPYTALFSPDAESYLQGASIPVRIGIQAGWQFLVALGLGLFLFFRKKRTRFHLLAIAAAILLDMGVSAHLNAPVTVYQKTDVKATSAGLDNLPEGFLIPDQNQHLIDNSEYAVPQIPNLWKNMNIFYKNPTTEGYAPYDFISFKALRDEGKLAEVTSHPLLFINPGLTYRYGDSEPAVDDYPLPEILEFSPNGLRVQLEVDSEVNLIFLQNHYPGWTAEIDGKQADIEVFEGSFMAVRVDDNSSVVEFSFRPQKTIALFYLWLFTWMVAGSLLVYYSMRKRDAEKSL